VNVDASLVDLCVRELELCGVHLGETVDGDIVVDELRPDAGVAA
jgi:hypothetical protein